MFRLTLQTLLLLAVLTAACGGTAPSAPAPSGPATIIQPLTVMTSDGRTLGSLTVSGPEFQPVTLNTTTLASAGIDLSTVDRNYFVLRAANTGSTLGAFEQLATDGTMTLVPTTNTRIIWMMNARNGADYARAYSFFTAGFVGGTRYDRIRRLTASNNTNRDFVVVDRDPAPIAEALALLSSTWSVAGVRLAELLWIGDAPTGYYQAGFGSNVLSPGAGGVGAGSIFVVSPIWAPLEARNVATEEAVETFMRFDDLFDKDTVVTLFGSVNGSVLLPVGADYLRFAALIKRP